MSTTDSTDSSFDSLAKPLQQPPSDKGLMRQMTVAEARRNKRLMVGGSCVIIVGVFFVILGLLVAFVLYPIIFEAVVYNMVKLKPFTDTWEAWVEPPIPIFYNFYFFHVLNAVDFVNGDADKPLVQEIGPYCYDESLLKKHIVMTDVDKVTYGQYSEYAWNATESRRLGCRNAQGSTDCSQDDEIMLLNIIIAAITPMFLPKEGDSIAEIMQKQEFLDAFNLALTDSTVCNGCQEDLFLTVTPRTFLWEGYNYKSIRALAYALVTTSVQTSEYAKTKLSGLAERFGFDLEEIQHENMDILDNLPLLVNLMPNATIGNGWYTVNNGLVEPAQALNTVLYKGESRLPEEWWPHAGPTPSANASGYGGNCKDLYGTDGTQYPPYPDIDLKLWVFIDDLCRPIWLDYMGDVKIRDSIDAYQFRPPMSVFDMHNPDNYCYCPEFNTCAVDPQDDSDEWDFSECDQYCKDGMIRIDGCSAGAPIVMSAPHFLHGEPSLWEAVDGLDPVYDLHDTYMNVEVASGVPFEAHKRIMVSINMRCTDSVDVLANCDDVVFPIFWADEAADLDDETYDFWMEDVERPYKIVLGVCIAIGVIMGLIIAGIGVFMCWRA